MIHQYKKVVTPLLFTLFASLVLIQAVAAQGDPPPIPRIHTVEEGENLTYIAETFGVTVQEILLVNNLTEQDFLFVGQDLIIPGGEGEAVAAVYTVQIGDSLAEIAAMFSTTETAVSQQNRLIYPGYTPFVGQKLSLTSRTGSAAAQPVTGTPIIVAAGESLLEIAARHNLTVAEIRQLNDLSSPAYLYPGQRLRLPGKRPFRNLPGEWIDIQLQPLPILQGNTLAIHVENLLSGKPSGQFAGQTLHFSPAGDGFVALIGLDAFTEPGLHTLELGGSGERPWTPFHQQIPITSVPLPLQSIQLDPVQFADLLDPSVRSEEDAFLTTIYTNFSDTRHWDGLFQVPVTNTVVTAGYGSPRSYNGGPVEIFHTGIDFGGAIGTPVLAAADGVVVLSEPLKLRGLTVIVDHGLGVMTGYHHLSEASVQAGDSVTAGQQLGLGGSSGLSTGPHLHWDLRVMNVPVSGLQWAAYDFSELFQK